jgi:hypothetical protein
LHNSKQEGLIIISGTLAGKLFDICHDRRNYSLGIISAVDSKQSEQPLLTVGLPPHIEPFGEPVCVYKESISRLQFGFGYGNLYFIGFYPQGVNARTG